jgi:plastocyanin domain-containing protein
MGMVRANVRVVGAANGAGAVIPSANAADIPANAQVVDLTWTDSGYLPNIIEVQQGRPTAVKVSASARTGGCMSTVVFPNFNQSAFVPAPGEPAKIVMLNTDQAQAGDYPITCGMGLKTATLRVNSAT